MSALRTGVHYPISLKDLPDSWEAGYVGDYALEIQPGFASGKHNKKGKGIPHIRPYNIDRLGRLDLETIKYVASSSDAKRLHAGDVLFNNTNSPELIGKTSVVAAPGDWGFSNHMTRIVFSDDMAPKFAAYQLHYLWMAGYFLHNCVKHVNQASVSSKTLARSVPFVKPPRPQQERIVAEIEKQFSRLDEAVANLKRVKANLKRYKAAVLKAAVEGKLTEEWRKQHPGTEPARKFLERILETRRSWWKGKGKYKELTVPDTTALPELPEGWVWALIGQVFDVYVGATPSRARPEYWDGGVPWISSGEVAFCRIKSTNESISAEGLENSSTNVHPVGTVLLGMIGEGKTRGQAAILDIEACNNQNSAAIRVSETDVLPEYVYSFLEKEYEDTRRRGSGGNQPALNKERVRQISFPLPPVAEQRHIVAEVDRRLSFLRETEGRVDANLQRAERFRQAALTKAFAGLLVKQLPGSEMNVASQVRKES